MCGQDGREELYEPVHNAMQGQVNYMYKDIEGYYKGSPRCIRIIVCMCVIREQEARSHLGSLILLMASFVRTYCSV